MSSLVLLFAMVFNLATIFGWHQQRRYSGAKRALAAALTIAAFIASCVLLANTYAWSRAPFIALGLLGISGWLYVFALPVVSSGAEKPSR